MTFPADFVEAVHRSSLVGVSAGAGRETALEIWVVAVGTRLFARSWGLSERSWYAAFLRGEQGFLQCEGRRFPVTGRRPSDADAINPLIDAEYLRKYDRGENSIYARGIVRPEHVDRTLEFLPLPDPAVHRP